MSSLISLAFILLFGLVPDSLKNLSRRSGNSRKWLQPEVPCSWFAVRGFYFHDKHGPYLVDMLIIAEAGVVTLFVGYPGKEKDAHAESHGKGYHLERNASLSVNQGLDNVVNLFHGFMDSVFSYFLSFQLQKPCHFLMSLVYSGEAFQRLVRSVK